MKAKYILALSFVFFAATLPGFSQASWNQPESVRRILGSNSANKVQLMRISSMMTAASIIAPINPEWAKKQAESAVEQMKYMQFQGNTDILIAMKQMLESINSFLQEMQQAQTEQVRSVTRV